MADDMLTWLRAQLDERERIALAARDAPPDPGTTLDLPPEGPWADFEAVMTPEQVLADIAAKRAMLERTMPPAGLSVYTGLEGPALSEAVRRLIALPFADRDGYQEGWRP